MIIITWLLINLNIIVLIVILYVFNQRLIKIFLFHFKNFSKNIIHYLRYFISFVVTPKELFILILIKNLFIIHKFFFIIHAGVRILPLIVVQFIFLVFKFLYP